MLSIIVRFKAKDDISELRRKVTIIGKDMRDVNDQAAKVVKYLTEQTHVQWFYEFIEENGNDSVEGNE